VHGIGGGFTGAGSKTVIPAKATAKVSIRWCPGRIRESNRPPSKVLSTTKPRAGFRPPSAFLARALGFWWKQQHPAIKVAAKAFSDIYGKAHGIHPLRRIDFRLSAISARPPRIPTILMGFGLPDDGSIPPNESTRIENYFKGITTSALLRKVRGLARVRGGAGCQALQSRESSRLGPYQNPAS